MITKNDATIVAFVSYCGLFNAEFRQILLEEYFHKDPIERSIPCSEDLALTSFLVDDATIGEWNLQGLPSDDLSIQNAIMVTRSSSFPLMIDPQGQAMSWIKRREPDLEKNDLITDPSDLGSSTSTSSFSSSSSPSSSSPFLILLF